MECACQVLDMVAESVEVEEATGFDPSGSSGALLIDSDPCSRVHNEDHSEGHSTLGWSSTTDDTASSQCMSALGLEGLDLDSLNLRPEDKVAESLADCHNAQLDGLDLAGKEALLVETFPGLKPFDIKWTLKKCKGDAGQAIEDLLNRVFIEENGGRQRGVEGFSDGDVPVTSKKGRNRKRRPALLNQYSDSSIEPAVEVQGRWDSAMRDMEFISTQTGMPVQQVSSLYHKHGGLISSTINAIIDAHQALEIDDDDSSAYLQASELNRDFPIIPITRLIAIVQLCNVAHSSAHDLIGALTSRPRSNQPSVPIKLEFRLPPPDLSDGAAETRPKPKSHNAVYAAGRDPQQRTSHAADGKDYKTLRNEAFSQASAAYRKGKSDPLMGGAAAYYSSLGRDYDVRAKGASAAAADAMAARQSTASQLDLHGIGVVDAVRIAREKVTGWWVRTGDRTCGYGGYRIVTGKGTHSEGGVARLGPAVGRMLIREGWRVEVGSGSMVVTGVVGKRKAF